MAWLPTVRAAVEKLATALLFKRAVPSTFAPSRNVTVPVGILQLPVSCAVKVTLLPPTLGLGELLTAIGG